MPNVATEAIGALMTSLIAKTRRWVADREEALTALTPQTAYELLDWPCI
jgi:hypothetical protein